MSVNFVVRPWERRLFQRCRRAWDLGARGRQGYEPTEPVRVFDFGEAIHDALDVYYFPGMWDWNRAIVRPLAVKGFEKSMRRQRDAYAQTCELSPSRFGTGSSTWNWAPAFFSVTSNSRPASIVSPRSGLPRSSTSTYLTPPTRTPGSPRRTAGRCSTGPDRLGGDRRSRAVLARRAPGHH